MSKPRMTVARFDAGEPGSFGDWLRKVRWYFSGHNYATYRAAVAADEARQAEREST